MVSGGARATSGPPPDPTALRRSRPSDASGWQTLPAAGRDGEVPEFPLTNVQPREWDLWRELWARPQAVMWEQLGQDFEVALFVRYLVRAESDEPTGDVMRLVRQYQESLGLSVQGMLRNRWKIGPAEETPEAAEETTTQKTAAPRKSAKDRLKVVKADGEGA